MSVNITNQASSPALRSQDAVVTFTTTAATTTMPTLSIGGKAGVVSSGKLGTISEIDLKGLTVKVKPATPDARFDSTSTPGVLNNGEIVTFF